MVKRLSINTRYLIAVTFMLLFILNDLLFDFAFSFQTSDIVAFVFTVLSALIVFICTGKIKNDEIKHKYYETSSFIKSNFDNAQVIFSILDIVCGLISIFSSYFFLSCAFKAVKIFYIPAKVLVVANKEKSLLKPITKFSYFWTSVRLLDEKGGIMANFLKSNKQTLTFGFLVSALCGVAVYYALPTFVALTNWALILIAVGCFALVFGLVFVVGHDTVESLALRLCKKVLPENKYNEIINAYNKAVDEIKKVEEENKLKAKVNAEVQKRLKAEEKAEKKAQNSVDVQKEKFEKLVQAQLEEQKKKAQ